MIKMYSTVKVGWIILLLFAAGFASAQISPGNAKGTVRDHQGKPLHGVTVRVQTSDSTIIATTATNLSGAFGISNLQSGNNYTFSFSYVGFESQKKTYQYAVGNPPDISVQLQPTTGTLNDVVVVGYGTQRKQNLTGAVDQIGADLLDNRPLPNLSQGLQGVLPNLNIRLGDGKPIQSPSYNVRGTTSIGQGGSALVIIDGFEGDPSMLNPADVATVTVLKDAASAAIYGARGSFGVVLITTKNPSREKTSLTYTVNQSIKKPITVPDLVTNGYQFASIFNEAWSAWNDYAQYPQNVNKTVVFSQAYLAELKRRNENPGLPKVELNADGQYVYYDNTDWFDILYKKVNSATEHNLSFSGNSGKASFLVTGRYFGQGGIFRYNSDDYSMYNFRAKGAIQLFPWLKIENNTDYSNLKYHNPLNVGEGGSIWRNIADEGHNMAPLLNPDGTLTYSAAYTVGDFYYGKNGIDMDNRVMRNITSFTGQFLNNALRLHADFTVRNTDNMTKQIRVPVPYSRRPGVIEYVGSSTNDIQDAYGQTQYVATNIYGDYEKRFAAHYLKATVGYNYEQSTYKALRSQRNGLINPNSTDINLALGQSISTSGGWERWVISGGFYRLNYAFKDRYLIEFDGRYDGTSKFPSNERYGFFPSVSGGWRISKEAFWNVPVKVISDLKIRASYGSLGNGNISSYAFQQQFSIYQSSLILNGVRPPATTQPGVVPDGLTWEKATTTNIGLDLTAFANRLTINGDAYVRKTTDMFTTGVTLPAVFGTAVPRGNYADLKTKGWELSAAWNDHFKLRGKQFGYSVRATLADYTSKITKFNNADKRLSDYYVGQKVGEIWGFETAGYFTSADDVAKSPSQALYRASTTGKWLPGDIKFADLNGDGVINNGLNTVNNPGDRKIIGNSTPRYTYGITLNADYRNFFISAFFQGVGHQDWYPGSEASYFWGAYNRPYNRIPNWQTGNMWTPENPNAYLPRLRGYTAQNGAGELTQTQTKYLQNIAYLRLKNLQIGYNLPASLAGKLKMASARVYLTGENLLTFSPLYKITRDIDVENTGGSDAVLTNGTSGDGYNYPMLQSFTIGLSVTF